MASSKELLIVFVYDLDSTQTEFNDPNGAIKYFYPSFVSSIQQMAITGQLVGFQNWCQDCFQDRPKIIKLANGQFVLRKFERFILAIGSDRNISETVSLYRAELITDVLNFYYGGIVTIYNQLDDKTKFPEILLNIFDTYLPSIQYYGNLLNSCFRFMMPKSSSNLYVTACQIIENLTMKKEIIGGIIAYKNKILVSHLSQSLSKVLIIADTFRRKNHAEENLKFHIPSAIKVLKVFVSNSEYDRLRKSKETVSESLCSRNVTLPLNFSIRKKMMKEKREKNFKFSNIPEEETLTEPQDKVRIRPCNLPLKLKTFRPEPGKLSFGEYDSYSDFIGKTSVACTPLAENKIFCGPVGSIFTEHDTLQQSKQSTSKKNGNVKQEPIFKPVIIQYFNNPMRSQIPFKKSWNDLIDLDFEIDEKFDCNRNYNTITDPMFPYFDDRKRPMSKSIFQLFGNDIDEMTKIKAKNTFHPAEDNIADENKEIEAKLLQDVAQDPSKPSIHQRKKMMRLPIKSITSTAIENDSGRPSTSSISDASTFDSPKSKKYSLQLTPLMAKLTSLALLDNDLTPNFTPVDILSVSKKIMSATAINRLPTENVKEAIKAEYKDMKKLDLLIYCQQNTKLAIIGEDNFFSENEGVVQSIFDLCNNRLSKLEQKLNNSVDATTEINNDYSFMNIGQLWDVRRCGGPFNHTDVNDIHLINSLFKKKIFSDVIVYDGFDGSLLYGNSNFEESETYYKCNSQKILGGLPAPFSDFDIVKVRKLLEMDQSTVLF